jgi:hypothetical protein
MLPDLVTGAIAVAIFLTIGPVLIRSEVKKALAQEREQTVETVVRALETPSNEMAKPDSPNNDDRNASIASDIRASAPVFQN